MIEILMPRLSDTMEEGAISAWHKKPGDPVEVGDLLVEIETDKATMEYEAYDAGVLQDIVVPEGDVAQIGAVIARLADGTEDPAPDSGRTVVPHPTPPPETGGTAPARRERLFATPLVRRLARENGIDLDGVVGSGPGGRVVRADVEALIARPARETDGGADAGPQPGTAPAPAPAPAAAAEDRASATTPGPDRAGTTAVPFDSVRQVISRRLTESSASVPHFSVTVVADVEELLTLRADVNARLADAGRPTVSVNDLVVRATAVALREHPGINASYSPEGRGQTLLHERVDIGVAMASDAGLVVPVVAGADRKTASQIAVESKELAARARERRLTPADMAGATFTISNLGMHGVEQFTAIINPPEGAILAVGAALPEPVAVDGAVQVRRRVRCTLSADHRIIDGASAAQFLATLRGLLERPLLVLA